ncbi:AraC family transcriptional regulator [Microbacterium sp. KUDC0406]|uniref:helix-turn-helix transcriptional regulator n=1 Tax=Microbacterium sp. KUDC0406 TaxID=2909588 RepID=UPI001F20CDB6|nr:AraC family transcriptional regulator [Microbacterium sp. KUDC0406]UJP10207.1 AraC family transcriptional regulator [Microbacterium sp. KUDC0406]
MTPDLLALWRTMTSLLRFETRDAGRVEETWKQFVPSAALHRVDPDRFRFAWFSADSPGFSLVSYELAAQVQSVVAPEDQLLACRVDSPGAQVGAGREDLGAGLPWLTDGAQVRARWEDTARVSALVFDRVRAELLARAMCGDDGLSLRVTGTAADRPGASAHWARTFDYLSGELEAVTHEDELILAGIRRQALWLVLTAFPTTFRAALERPAQTRSAPAAVRRALDYIDENAHRPITVDDIAAAVHMSTRGLQYAFRRALDATPAECLRNARLEGAHRELLDGAADPIAVIARRWGFAHPSRFAAAYRTAYGVLPAVTAGRRR